MDVHSPAQRSANMAAIKGKNTKPERIVRSVVHALGYRYRLHRKDLPGKPDLTFSSRKKVIFVHGCFWHMHECPYGRVAPKTNPEFWETKRRSNVDRDRKHEAALRKNDWKVLTVWECALRDLDALNETLVRFLNL
jgi:DNA mismatch endonuclease (patch repair protein)